MTKIQDVAEPITAEQLISARERAKNGVIWKIRQEIERLKGVAEYYPYHGDYLLALSELSDFLDTLPEQPKLKPMNIPSAGGGMSTTPPSYKLDVKPDVDLEKEECVGVAESPLKTFQRVNEFEEGASYRH